MASSGLRIRLLEPSIGVVSGGTRVVIHGKGFRPLPHSLLVRFRLHEATVRVDVPGRFLLETQLECVVPSFKDDIRNVIARHTSLAPTSATVLLAPHLVPVHVEVILDSDRVSNALAFLLHQEISVARIAPQFVLMSPPTTVAVTLNLLKLSTSARLFPLNDKDSASSGGSKQLELTEITSMPVFVRIRQVSERTGALSERTVEARWSVSPVGVYEVEFDAVMMTFGDAAVEVTLNRHDFFRSKVTAPNAVGYCVHRDVTLSSIDPCCISVTSGRSTEVRVIGEGYVDTGDLTVRLLQRDIQEAALFASNQTGSAGQVRAIAQLSATYVSPTEIRCSVHPNMPFGLTYFQISLNGGRQYGKGQATALLHRDRVVESIEPSFANLEGNTIIKIRLSQLTVDEIDAPGQIRNLVPPRRIRVKFEARDETETASLVKIVNADISSSQRQAAQGVSLERGIINCRVPSFVEDMKQKKVTSSPEVPVAINLARVQQFYVSVSLGGNCFFGTQPFGCFWPPIVLSMNKHHGPCSGGTVIVLRMKHPVPPQLAIQVRFVSLSTREFETVPALVGSEYYAKHSTLSDTYPFVGSPEAVDREHHENHSSLIVCMSPVWRTSSTPELTKIQVSLDGGFNFVPLDEEHELMAGGLVSPRPRGIPYQLVRDMSHLYFLFYPVPRLTSVSPMSADIQGGSFIKIGGDHVVDHGGQISVVFQSSRLSRKVVGFVESGELRCCVPPFDVGPAIVFVSLNGEQYTRCEFVDQDSRRRFEFVYYSSPLLQRLSPLSACISHSSMIRIFGVNLIETGRVTVRFGFINHSGKLVYKDVPGRAQEGIIMAQSPLFSAEYGNLKAVVDVALNGNDFSGKSLSLYYYASYSIKRIEPAVGAVDILIPVTLSVSQTIVSDTLLVRVRFKQRSSQRDVIFGPVPVTRWESTRVNFVLPAICEYVPSLQDIESACIDLSFDGSFFCEIGNLLDYYKPYKLPTIININPLVGHYEHETKVVAQCFDVLDSDAVTITLTMNVVGKHQVETQKGVNRVLATTNAKKQTLTWCCPPISRIFDLDSTRLEDVTSMLLPVRLAMQISTVDGQLLVLPFQFQYYRTPVLMAMSPRVGYICGGSLISFQFSELIETPTVDFRFGTTDVTSGLVREDDKRFVECLSPALEPGVHALSMSFNEQLFEEVHWAPQTGGCAGEGCDDDIMFDQTEFMTHEGIPSRRSSCRQQQKRAKCSFQAFSMPLFATPPNHNRVYGFGSIDGGSYVFIRGSGFIADGKIYVRFCSALTDSLIGPNGVQSELVVKARVIDEHTIICASPPATRSGRVSLQVTYNLQQYTDSSGYFEYHERTTFASRGILCGPVSGGTPVCIQVEDPTGLPEDKSLLTSSCMLRYSNERGHSREVNAMFDEGDLTIHCVAPPWPSNELVSVEVTMTRDSATAISMQQFSRTGVSFLFYDPPDGLITIEPSAGPITGGTEVLAWCGKMVDTGEIMVSVTMLDDEETDQMKKLARVGEDEDSDSDDKPDDHTASSESKMNKEVYLVRGKIVGEAVAFRTPAVSKPGVAYLNIALNGINYTSTRTSNLRFKYYIDPSILRISPTWCAVDTASIVTIYGDFFEDHGCKPAVRFLQQQIPSAKDTPSIIVEGSFIEVPSELKTLAMKARALQCTFEAPCASSFEVEVSLNNGQQFSRSKYMAAAFGNYSGSACTALLPFRCFSSPFLLATPTGSVAGGSTVTLFMSKKLSKLLSRESKCQVHFAPMRNSDAASANVASSTSTSSPHKAASATFLDGVIVGGDIDHTELKITCRAPLLRTACVAVLDLLLPMSVTTPSHSDSLSPASTKSFGSGSSLMPHASCASFFGTKEREKFHAYESPTITELAPSCGPLSGGTCVVIEGTNIVETGQIFVRFRSNTNERECVLVPATFSRTFPDGSLSASPLLICQTPQVEVIDRFVVSVTDPVSPVLPHSPTRGSTSREGSTGVMTAKARAHSFQLMAEQSLRRGLSNILRVTRVVLKNAPASSICSTISVLVDFTMNAGEQFIAHSVPFQFYPLIDPGELKWSPRHVPTQCFDRSTPTETRVVTVHLPKSLRSFADSASASERASFYFEGSPQQIFSPVQKRRGSSIVLHETGDARELLVLDAPPAAKLRKESTMRRRSTYFRNSSISATSNNLLDSSGASLAASSSRPRAVIPRHSGGSRRPSGANTGSGNAQSQLTWQTDVSGPTSRVSVLPRQVPGPYIAAKIVNGGLELSCPIPEFSTSGSVQVHFSFNAQQFVCLGELFIHDPPTIREDRQHRYTSTIGGDRFVLYCSPSSVFTYLPPGNVLTEAELIALQQCNTGVIKSSRVFRGVAAGGDGVTIEDKPRAADYGWRNRTFFVLQLHVVPQNARQLRKIVASVRSRGTKAQLASCVPDDSGCCVFEATDWSSDVTLTAAVQPSTGTSTFSTVIPTQRMLAEVSGPKSNHTHAVLLQLPTAPHEVKACAFGYQRLVESLAIVDVEGISVSDGVERSCDLGTCTCLFNPLSAGHSNAHTWFICLDMSVPDHDATSEVHVVVVNAHGEQVYLTALLGEFGGFWIVALISLRPEGHYAVVEVDCRAETLNNLGSIDAVGEVLTALASSNPSGHSQKDVLAPVLTSVQFACADSSRNLSVSVPAQIVLRGDLTLASLLSCGASVQQDPSIVLLHCEMPALTFNGPTILSVLVDGVTFSNSLCVHCYDPRLWQITCIDPPCGLVHASLRMRVKGDHFVDSKNAIIRVSDASRYQDFQATLERYRLLIVRVAAVRNLRGILLPQMSAYVPVVVNCGATSSSQKAQLQSLQAREEAASNACSFSVVARVQYRDQVFRTTARESPSLAALPPSSSVSSLSWEDQFEVQIPAEALSSALLLVTVDLVEIGESRRWELGRVVIPTVGLQEATLTKRTYPLEEQFRWRNRCVSNGNSPPASDVDVFLHLSPLMTSSDVFVCELSPFVLPQLLRVQISSGDSFFSPCPPLEKSETSETEPGPAEPSLTYRPLFQTYELPVVTETTPRVLPRSAGGEITISGVGFVSGGDSKWILVHLYGCSDEARLGAAEDELLQHINASQLLESSLTSRFFVRDERATFLSSTTLKLVVPPRLATYHLYYRVSVDGGINFSQATCQSHVILYSADSIEPKGGPVSGNTYVGVQGTNLNACMSLGNLAPIVKLTWMRGVKELESVIVRGEFYPPEDIVYIYTPQSKFGLQNVTVFAELALVRDHELTFAPSSSTSNATPVLTGIHAAFGQDEVPFVVYQTPMIKSVSPLQSLVYGLSSVELIVQGLDEKAVVLMKNSIKVRFKRRGQMQVADVHVTSLIGANSDWKMSAVIPRFVVGSAVSTEVTPTALPPAPSRQAQVALRSLGHAKVWTRQGGIFVALLRARNLFVAKKSSNCNPFVVVHCNKAQLKSTRKDGTSSPVWNELFDFDWRSEKELPRWIRLSVENQLTSNQSEMIGQVTIAFGDACNTSRPFCARAWFPLKRVTARGVANLDTCSSTRTDLGEIEVAIAYAPLPPKKIGPRFLQAAALKSSIMSAMQQHKKAAAAIAPVPLNETQRARKARLLRAFRRRGAPSSLVPNEIIAELAVNGQDYWSSAPSRCLLVPTPIVLTAEPSYICLSGGTPLTVTGMNFVQNAALRIAFAVGDSIDPATSGRGSSQSLLDGKRIAIVEAKYRSGHCITCVTPSLLALGATVSSMISVFVSINGLDFDSISLPSQSIVATIEVQSTAGEHANTSRVQVLQILGDKCVVDTEALDTHLATPNAVGASRTLSHQVRVYLRPIIHNIRPADGVYTSSLVIEGDNFCNTGLAIARYCSTKDRHDVRTSRVTVVSSQWMECSMPDFPRGTIVTMSIAMNGVEFVAYSVELAVFQSPRLTKIVPSWISVVSEAKQDVRILGINLTTQVSASGSVQVAFQRGDAKKVVKGQCVDGEVLCSVPKELETLLPNERDHAGKAAYSLSIFVDVWLGGTHKTFTGQPLALQLYCSIPVVVAVTPTNGPIYGGYRVLIEGSGFMDTGDIVARFQALVDPSGKDSNLSSAKPDEQNSPPPSLHASHVDTSARFLSSTCIECMAPAFPQEGVFIVSISLNGVEFNTASIVFPAWFTAWQNWQRRKQFASQRASLEAALMADAQELMVNDLVTAPPMTPSDSSTVPRPPSSSRASKVETAFGRRVSSQSKLRPSQSIQYSTEHADSAGLGSPSQRHQQQLTLCKLVESENFEHVEDHFVDVRLLQWHPATTDDKSRSLVALLTDLFNAPDTQQIMIRRTGYVFRAHGSRDTSSGHYSIGSLGSFTKAFRLIFPHAPDKQFEELWRALDPSHVGYVSLQAIMKRFILAESLRPPSPEPGPTHYNPSFTLVEPKPPSTLILPQSSAPQEETGLPSELFMNYDAFKAVRPRVQGGRFLKREPLVSWCDPVPKDVLFKDEVDEEIERSFTEQQRGFREKARTQLVSLTSTKEPSLSGLPRESALPGKQSTWRPGLLDHSSQQATGRINEMDEPMVQRRGGVSRGERLIHAAVASENSLMGKATSPRIASPASTTPAERHTPSRRSRSILHNDIAPLYLKFLRSKEAQKGNTELNE